MNKKNFNRLLLLATTMSFLACSQQQAAEPKHNPIQPTSSRLTTPKAPTPARATAPAKPPAPKDSIRVAPPVQDQSFQLLETAREKEARKEEDERAKTGVSTHVTGPGYNVRIVHD